MELSELTKDERTALVALLEMVVAADGDVSYEESQHIKDVIHAAFVDTSVRRIKRDFSEAEMRAAITRNGGDRQHFEDLFQPEETLRTTAAVV